MKQYRIVLVLLCLTVIFTTACEKEVSAEFGKLPPISAPDTAHNTPAPPPPMVSITIKNASFEDSLHSWKKETTYKGNNGFKARGYAARTGKLGLSFYASQRQHYNGAKQETPWNGKFYQTVKGLKDGQYRFQIYAGAVGEGMYLWADGGAGEAKVLIHSADFTELNTLDFEVKGGVAKFGFACINADGAERFAPYFQADDAALLKKL